MKTGILSFGIGGLLLTNLLFEPTYAATKLTTSQHHLLASSDDCIEAHDACLLAISPNRPDSPVKQYIIEQVCGDKLYLDLQLGLAEQARERRFIAKKFCHGVARLSSMEVPFAIHQYHDSDFRLADARAMQFSIAHAIEIIKSIYEEEIKLATFVIYNQPSHDKQDEFFVLINEVSRALDITRYAWVSLLTESEDITVSNSDRSKQYNIKLPHMAAFNEKTSGVNISTTKNAKIALALFQLFYADITTYEETLKNQQAMILSAMKQEEQITNIDLKQPIWHMNIETNGQANKNIDYLDPQVSQFNYNNKDCFEISPLNIISVDKNGTALQLDSSNALKAIATHSAAIDAVKLCHGQAFYSALRDPRMTDYQPIQSVRDLNRLNIALQQSYLFITSLIDKMTDLALDACSGIHSASDLAQMDITYQNYLSELDTLAKGKTFQHLFILSRELSFSAQTKNKGDNLSLQTLNLTSDALALSDSTITSQANAQDALGNLISARKTLYDGLGKTLDLQQRIDEVIKADETWVVTDLLSAH